MTPRRNPALEDPAIHTLDVNEPLVDTLLHADPAARQHAEPLMVRLRREQLDRPVIYVGTGTCGLGAGAGETVQAIRQYLADRDQPVDLVEVGCIGLCTEPLDEEVRRGVLARYLTRHPDMRGRAAVRMSGTADGAGLIQAG